MTAIAVQLPTILAALTGGKRELTVEGGTIREALDDLVRRHPQLGVHLFEESGAFRQHVLCFHNDVNVRWLKDLEKPLAPADTLTILQAVSGG